MYSLFRWAINKINEKLLFSLWVCYASWILFQVVAECLIRPRLVVGCPNWFIGYYNSIFPLILSTINFLSLKMLSNPSTSLADLDTHCFPLPCRWSRDKLGLSHVTKIRQKREQNSATGKLTCSDHSSLIQSLNHALFEALSSWRRVLHNN